jgi:hypothetical protein
VVQPEVNSTDVHQTTVDGLFQRLLQGQLVLPRFQRTEVWNERQKRALIQSIRSRLPIGSLLVYQTGGAHQILVDGLQRTIAIRDYKTSPKDFITAESLQGQIVDGLHAVVIAIASANGGDQPTIDSILSCIDAWIDNAPSLTPAALTADDLATIVNQRNDLNATQGQLYDIRQTAYRLYELIQETANIDDYPIVLVEFRGQASLLPDIFRNINSGGAPLDEFDEFATDWISFHSPVLSAEARGYVAAKWGAAEAKGLVVEQWHDGAPENGYTFWEHLYGLGMSLHHDYPLLFGNVRGGSTETQRVSFYLAGLAHGVIPRVNEIRRLPGYLSDFHHEVVAIDLSLFEAAARQACERLVTCIRPSAGMRLNSRLVDNARLDNLSSLSQFLILGMVSRYMAGRWIPYTWEEKDGWEQDWELLDRELPSHLLYEVLQGSWSGAGDSAAYAATWDSDQISGRSLPDNFDPTTHFRPANRYSVHRGREEWTQVLDVWLSEETSGQQRVNRNISKEAKLVLRYLYSDVPFNMHERYRFDIDHQLPVARLARLVELLGSIGWPMSAIGNLALLPVEINQAKGEMTPVEYLADLDDADRQEQQPIFEYAAIVPVPGLDIPKNQDEEDDFSRDQFIEIVRARQVAIRNKLLGVLGV